MGLIIKGLHIEEILINIEDEEEQAEPLQEEPKEEEQKAPRKRSKPLDKGKVGALYKAGWKVAKIADEMRCDQSSIYRVIRELGL